MKLRIGFWHLAWALVALLALCGAMLTMGKVDNEANPDATSFGPSGVAAFAELLRRQGYQVESIPGIQPKLDADTLAIVLWVPPKRFGAGSFDPEGLVPDQSSGLAPALQEHFSEGGRALVALLPEDFLAASIEAQKAPAEVFWTLSDLPSKPKTTHAKISTGWGESSDWPYEYDWLSTSGLTVWQYPEDLAAFEVIPVATGLSGYIGEGLCATNRFIKEHDNAVFLMSCVAMLAKPGSKIAFLEAAHGVMADPSLMEALGPWAVGAWWQAVLLFLAIVFTLGKRFGLPDEAKPREAGSRDLADALSAVMRRGKSTDLAMAVLAQDADRELRRRLKLPRDAPTSKRDGELPASMLMALKEAEVLSKNRANKADALKVARRLESEMRAYCGVGRNRKE